MHKSSFIAALRYQLPLLLGAMFSLLLFYVAVQLNVSEHRADFERAGKAAVIDVREHLDDGRRLVEGVAQLFVASELVTEREFHLFAAEQLEVQHSHKYIRALGFLAVERAGNPYWLSGEEALFQPEGLGLVFQPRYQIAAAGESADWLSRELVGSERSRRAIAESVRSGGVLMGGFIRRGDGHIYYLLVQAVRDREGGLLGVLLGLSRPSELLQHITGLYQINLVARIGDRVAGEGVCCRGGSGFGLPTLQGVDTLEYRGERLELVASRPLEWTDMHLKGAVLALLAGALLSWMVWRLRKAGRERSRILMERNQLIRRQVEEQTRNIREVNAELEQQRFALDQHSIVSIADVAGNITYVNDKFCEISGYSREELLGRNHRIVKSAHHPTSFYQEMWHTISQGEVWHGVVCNRKKDGGEYWVNSTVVPFVDKEGLPYQYVSIRTDVTPIKKAEESIAQQQYELNTILDNVPAMIWFKDRDGCFLRVNLTAAQLFGKAPAELAGRRADVFMSAQSEVSCREAEERVIESGQPELGQLCQYRDRNGNESWARVDRVPYRDANGDTVGIIVMAVDVTKEIAFEKELKVNEDRLKRSQYFANIGTWDWNVQTGELYWSERIAPLFGYESGEVETTYENFVAALHPEDRQAVLDAVDACVSKGVEYNIEHRVVWQDGTVRWLLERGDVVRDESGQPLHMLGVVQDITERKLAQEQLNRFKTSLDLTEDCVFMFSPKDLHFFYANHGAMEQVGYSYDELLQMTPVDIKPEYDEAAFLDLIQPLQRGEKESLTFETVHRHKDGTLIPVEILLQYIAPQNEPPRYVAIVRNIAERKQMETSLIEAKEEAEQANRAKSEFLSSMSHELRTPLNAVIGFAQLLETESNLSAQQRENVQDILKAGRHLLDLINDVLDLSRIEAGKLELSIDKVSLQEVVASALSLIQPQVDHHGITLDYDADCVQGYWVHADHTRTKQVLLNLLSNAMKYNSEGGRIGLSCSAAGTSRLRICVSDTGKGIPQERLPQLFEAFNRLGADATGVEGTGIGLVITRQLVEMMGGSIEVESREGEGSCFCFELPRLEGEAPSVASERKRIEQEGLLVEGEQEVLYIEDNPVNLKLVSQLISRKTRLHLHTTAEPKEGLVLARERQPALILLDINLPGMSGYEVLQVLRADPATAAIPVVALSANAMEADLARGEAAGFAGYLTKPLDVKEFFSTLKKLL